MHSVESDIDIQSVTIVLLGIDLVPLHRPPQKTAQTMQQIFFNTTPKILLNKVKQYAYPYLEIWHNGKRTRIHLGCKVIATQWCHEKQRAYISPLLCNFDNKNNEIANTIIEASIANYRGFIDYIRDNPHRAIQFHSELRNYMVKPRKQTQIPEDVDVLKVIEQSIINNAQINRRTAYNNYIGKGLKALKEFCKFRENPINNFDMIGPDFIDEFVEYLKNGHYTNNGEPYAMSTLNSIIKYAVSAIKCLPVAYLPKVKAQTIQIPQLTDKTANNNQIALRDSEILKLWRYKPQSKQDEEIRDMFLLLCLTGQRIGDLSNVIGGISNIEGVPCLNIVQEKCSHKLSTDIIFPLVADILNKYPSASLPLTDIKKKINNNIGRIAKEATIGGTERISIHYQGNDKPKITEVDRCSLIHSHTARRTFVSILSVHGWNYEKIGKYTGQSIKIVALYDKSTSIDERIYKESQPSDRLKIIGENPQECHSIQKEPLQRYPNSIEEARQVLSFLGVETHETDLGILIGMICIQERNILNRCSQRIDITTIKDIFNTKIPLTDRCKSLKFIIDVLGHDS